MSLLYFFFNTEGSAVKIGKSGNPHLRASQLLVLIDRSRSFEIEFTNGSAGSVERMLHYLFRDHKPTCRQATGIPRGSASKRFQTSCGSSSESGSNWGRTWFAHFLLLP